MTDRLVLRAVELRTYVVERPVVEPHRLHVLLTREQAADYFQVSEDTLDRWAKAGKLRPFKEGATVRYVFADIEAFVEQSRGTAA